MRALFLLAVAVLLTACQSASKPEVVLEQEQPIPAYSAETFFDNETVLGNDISFDDSAVLVTSDKSGVFNVYRYPIDGSEPSQLTFSETDAYRGLSWFPADDRFLFSADQGGNELTHIYVQTPDGSVTDLTPGDKVKAMFLGWQRDNRHFFIATNERDPKAFDLYRYEVDGYQRTRIYENTEALSLMEVSPDGRYLTLVKSLSNTDDDLYLLELNQSEATPVLLTDGPQQASHTVYTFTPDSSALIYGTNAGTEFVEAWEYDIEDGTKTLAYSDEWDVTFYKYSENGRYLVTGLNADARTEIAIVDIQQQSPVRVPNLPAGDISGVTFTSDENTMVFYLKSDTAPANLYSYQFGGELKQLTDTLNPAIDPANLVASEVVRFSSFDDVTIPGLLYKPHQANRVNPVPAVILIHGGPGGQSRAGYSALIQHLVNHGYAIFAVNNRGSSGYGKTFFHLDDQRHGEDDLQDIVFAKRYLTSLPWVNASEIGVMGGSYGGYLTMAAMAFTQEFEVGINIFGVTNWVRTLNSIPPWWESFREYLYAEMGDPATDEARLYRISPLFHADKITQPVLVVQGANDPRVLQVESDEMVAAIRENDVPVEYVLFDDEGHGFRKKSNRIVAQNAYLDFLNTHLKTTP